jgi:hypothetical protein
VGAASLNLQLSYLLYEQVMVLAYVSLYEVLVSLLFLISLA